jgi:hypothetical protein
MQLLGIFYEKMQKFEISPNLVTLLVTKLLQMHSALNRQDFRQKSLEEKIAKKCKKKLLALLVLQIFPAR